MLSLNVLLLKYFFFPHAVLKILFLSACLGPGLFNLLRVHWDSWNCGWMVSLPLKNTELFFF